MKKVSEKSINAKVINVARKLGVGDVNRVRIVVALERLIARLMTRSYLRENIVFNGGFVMVKTTDSNRFTRDLDAIIRRTSREKLYSEVSAALNVDLGDGFHFWGLSKEIMDMNSGYNGIRYSFHYKTGERLGNLNKSDRYPRIHLDVSVDFSIGAPPKQLQLSSEVDLYEPISWSVYPHEYIIADKLHALISREGDSTRAKDIYDLSILMPGISDLDKLTDAIVYIFNILKTEIPNSLHGEVSAYDTTILENVWKKVQLNTDINFKEAWNVLLDELLRYDGR
ncbi:MAG: hypothetical protein CME64_06835 [Halobacteriovoraceae bacterium]|nr:hypothetical protein [Halobacteriovoraceae bacterium]|tara:strand:+ start:11997 stop:12845 length:849 start_codon:yes stop_codon:yes gene_type:complete